MIINGKPHPCPNSTITKTSKGCGIRFYIFIRASVNAVRGTAYFLSSVTKEHTSKLLLKII